MATDEEARAARDARLQQLHERLTAAVDQLVSGEDWKRALEFAARFRAKSFNNTLLIWAQHAAAFERGLDGDRTEIDTAEALQRAEEPTERRARAGDDHRRRLICCRGHEDLQVLGSDQPSGRSVRMTP